MNRYDIYYKNGLHLIFYGKIGCKIAIWLWRKTKCSIAMLEDL